MPIPASARARPRGLDRDELQERMRTRRPGDATFRRGTPVGGGSEEGGRSAYRPYRPEPEDELLHPGAGAAERSTGSHVDNTAAGFDDRVPPPVVPQPVVPPPVASFPPPVVPLAVAGALPDEPSVPEPLAARLPPAQPASPEPSFVQPTDAAQQPSTGLEEPYDDVDAYDYAYAPPRYDRDRPSGAMSALAVGGFVLLGILAIGVGAFISGIFAGGVAQATPSPTPVASAEPTVTPQATSSLTPSSSEVASPVASQLPPFTFADGFNARTEPCIAEPASQDGCGSSGASLSGGSVWVWVGFRQGNNADLLGVKVVDAAGAEVGTGSLALGSIGCGDSCSGWARFRFGGLGVGNYTIRIDRNGLPAAEGTFTVTG